MAGESIFYDLNELIRLEMAVIPRFLSLIDSEGEYYPWCEPKWRVTSL